METSSSKQAILESLRRHTVEQFDCPDLTPLKERALTYANPVRQFAQAMTQVGGQAVELAEGQTIGQLVHMLYPDAKRVACALPGLTGCDQLPGTPFDPDTLETPAELNGTDVAIVPADLAVCENACCYLVQRVKHRALYFIAEALVIVVRREDLVNNMHEAFDRLNTAPTERFACFVSGPSKTADIEQALVMGAHGARSVTAIII